MKDFWNVLLETYQKTNQFGLTNGMDLIDVKSGEITYRLIINHNHLATPTTAHGGIVAGYMDGIMGVAALSKSSEKLNLVSTVEFKINYLKPVFLNDVLIGKGSVISAGNRIIVAKGEIYNEKTNELIAIATGTFNAYPYQKSGMTMP